MPKAFVTTTIRQEIEVPEGAGRTDIYEFLAEYQSFRGAFQGVDSLDGQYRILDLVVVAEEVDEIDDVAYDD